MPAAAGSASSRSRHAGLQAPHCRWLPERELGWAPPREMPAVCQEPKGCP